MAAEASGRLRTRIPPLPRGRPEIWIAAIVATYAAQLAMVWYGATHGAAYAPWRAAMPFPVMDLGAAHAGALAFGFLVCGGVQTIALVAIYRATPARAAVAIGSVSLLVLSMAAPALASADLYSNAGYGMLGAAAYAPPAHAFAHSEFSWIELWWGTPMVPSPYGPLWNAVDAALLAPVPTLVGKMLVLRAFCALALAVLTAAMWRFGLPARVLAVTLLNPALFMQFVANAHNDAVIVAVVALGAVAARRRPILAASAIVAAGLLKLPYVLLGLPILAAVRAGTFRFSLAALAIACVLAVSWGWGGAAYLEALVFHARHAPGGFFAWHVVAGAVAAALVLGALAGLRRPRTAVWLVPPLGALYPAFLYPWYLAWALPYALGRRRVLAYLLVWLPTASVLVNQDLVQVWTLVAVFPSILLAALLPPPARLRSPRRSLR